MGRCTAHDIEEDGVDSLFARQDSMYQLHWQCLMLRIEYQAKMTSMGILDLKQV